MKQYVWKTCPGTSNKNMLAIHENTKNMNVDKSPHYPSYFYAVISLFIRNFSISDFTGDSDLLSNLYFSVSPK